MINKKQILYIISSNVLSSSPVGIRIEHLHQYLCRRAIVSLIGKMPAPKFNIAKKIVLRLLRLFKKSPDADSFFLVFYRWKIKRSIKKQTWDMIFIQTLPFSFYYLCPMIKQLNPSIPIVVDMSDPLVINAGFHSMTVRQQKELKAIEEHCFSSIDYLIVLNKEIKDYYLQLSKPPPQVLVIEQGVVANQFMPVSQTQQKAAIENSLRFMYAGGFIKTIREPFALYNAVLKSKENIQLTVYSKFNRYPAFIPPESEQIIWHNAIPHQQLLLAYETADVIVFIDNNDNYQVPGKLFEILMNRKPILFIYTNPASPALYYVKEEEGIFKALNNEQSILSAIEAIVAEGKIEYNRNTEKYTWEYLLKRMDFLFKN